MEKEPPDLSYYKCIKTSLKSIAKNEFVISKINDATIMANKIVIHSLQFYPKFTQTAKSNLENKDSKPGVLNLQGCKTFSIII